MIPPNTFQKGHEPWNKGIEWEAMKGNQHAKGQPASPGAFKKGHVPAMKGRKGVHNSPATEFKPGCSLTPLLPVGTTRERTRRGVTRRFVKVADPNTWIEEATHVWETANGPVPRGHLIHHLDINPLNNDLANLACITRSRHATIHLLIRHHGPSSKSEP
jgi:hypothetical protein